MCIIYLLGFIVFPAGIYLKFGGHTGVLIVIIITSSHTRYIYHTYAPFE